MINFQKVTDNAFLLVDQMMSLTNGKLQFFTIAGVYREGTNQNIAIRYGWTGEIIESRAPGIARYKVAQLLAYPTGTQFALTPNISLALGPDYDYPGGVLRLVDGDKRYIVACSGQSGEVDTLVATSAMYSMLNQVQLNHFGITLPTEDALSRTIIQYEELHEVDGIQLTTGSGNDFHHRCYIPVKDPSSPYGIFYIELRWFPYRANIVPKYHFDFVTADPIGLLKFSEHCLGLHAEFWDDAEDGTPVGMLVAPDKKRDHNVAIMARNKWFDPRQN